MAYFIPADHPLRHLFAGCIEHTFIGELGMCDPSLTDYLAQLLANFIHIDGIFPLHNAKGRRLEEVAEMMAEAYLTEKVNSRQHECSLHRHIGDFTLFWTGVYPEGLNVLRQSERKDHLIDYVDRGKQSYSIVAKASHENDDPPPRVFRRLADDFEMCAYGLYQARKTWEQAKEPPS